MALENILESMNETLGRIVAALNSIDHTLGRYTGNGMVVPKEQMELSLEVPSVEKPTTVTPVKKKKQAKEVAAPAIPEGLEDLPNETIMPELSESDAVLTETDVRDAAQKFMLRVHEYGKGKDAKTEAINILKSFNVSKITELKGDQYAEAIKKFNAGYDDSI